MPLPEHAAAYIYGGGHRALLKPGRKVYFNGKAWSPKVIIRREALLKFCQKERRQLTKKDAEKKIGMSNDCKGYAQPY